MLAGSEFGAGQRRFRPCLFPGLFPSGLNRPLEPERLADIGKDAVQCRAGRLAGFR